MHHEHVRRQQALATGKEAAATEEFSLSPKKTAREAGGPEGGGGEDELKPEEEEDVPINALGEIGRRDQGGAGWRREKEKEKEGPRRKERGGEHKIAQSI